MNEFQQIWMSEKGQYYDEFKFVKEALETLGLHEHSNNLCEQIYILDQSRYIDLIHKKARECKNYDLLERLWFYNLIYC